MRAIEEGGGGEGVPSRRVLGGWRHLCPLRDPPTRLPAPLALHDDDSQPPCGSHSGHAACRRWHWDFSRGLRPSSSSGQPPMSYSPTLVTRRGEHRQAALDEVGADHDRFGPGGPRSELGKGMQIGRPLAAVGMAQRSTGDYRQQAARWAGEGGGGCKVYTWVCRWIIGKCPNLQI
ncbi:hypothetical protein ACP70R_000750 [Stipagrostis hirtigluma subsp. patula]